MIDEQDYWKKKAQCLSDIREALPRYADRLNECDERLMQYIEDAISNNASHSNYYELLGIRKELRLIESYDMDIPRVQRTLRAIEGRWENGRHVKGGLKFSTPRGAMHVRLMPFQAWLIWCIYAFKVDVSMEREYHEGDQLLPTEWVKDGIVWDTRRLTQESHWFLTRKSGKTELGAAVDFVEVCFLGDVNGQALIATNSAEQSRIAFKAIKEFAMQVDPSCSNRMGGKFFRLTRNEMNWQPGNRMKGEIKCMAAGKTPKDGLYASVVHADEHGQAGYVNGRSDMQAAVDTCFGSTGPRREKLLLHTTTAGRIQNGPYKQKLEQVEASLEEEMNYPLGEPHRTDEDVWTAFLLQLDKPEITDDLTKLDDPELFKKCNRSIGTTVQPTYYRERLHEAATGTEDTKQEVLTKDLNIWQTGKVKDWLKSEDIRPLQTDRRIDDCIYSDGWIVFAGMDFSRGDDLNGAAFLCYNTRTNEFFGDMDVYMSEEAVNDSPIRELLRLWACDGWLTIVPGKTFDPSWPVNRIIQLDEKGVNFGAFGYDPYNAKVVVNAMSQWVFDIGLDPKQIIQPVRQNFATYNPAVSEFDYMVKRSRDDGMGHQVPDPMIHLSMNPLWPYCFGCCTLQESNDGMGNVKPVKRDDGAGTKVDPVQMLLSGLILYDQAETQISK